MNPENIQNKLRELYLQHRIIFWNDPEGEFEESLLSLELDNVEVLRPDKIGQLKTKVIVEIDKPTAKFLIYSIGPLPQETDDWLLDIRLYSYRFYADTATLTLDELGLQHLHLREHIAKRKKFFTNKQRTAQLQKIILPGDLENDVDRKILAVLGRSDNDRLNDILQSLFSSFPFEEGLDAVPENFVAIQKMELEDVFWNFVQQAFGYKHEKPTLRHLLTCLFISDLYSVMGNSLSENVRQFVLPGEHIRDVAVFISEWRDSVERTGAYDALSEMVSEAIGFERYIGDIPIVSMKGLVTFFALEQSCASKMKVYVLDHLDTLDSNFVISFCRDRQNSYWTNKNKRHGSEKIQREALWAVYEALIVVAQFIEKKKLYSKGFLSPNSSVIFQAYINELHIFDRLYRLFYENAKIADNKGWSILKDLKEYMEDMYQNWFLEPLSILWEERIKLETWKIDGIKNQYDFFNDYPANKAGDKNATVFVIISDGLRYEAGVEITEELNGKYRFKAKIEAVLSTVPSYTSLGMAALLPHNRLDVSSKGDVLVDGKSSASTDQRNEILSTYKGLAIKSDELIQLSRDKARDIIRGKDVVYIYHNTVDAMGDEAKTEDETFSAVRKAINEVGELVKIAVNDHNARFVFVTADHGFVYMDKHPDATNRNQIPDLSAELIKSKKRYLLGRGLPVLKDTHQGKVSITLGSLTEQDLEFAVPKGMSLFNFSGGSRYFHGGISLQEVTVPVITVTHVRGHEKEKTREKTVGIQVLGQDHRITTGRHRFEIIQTDAVDERVKAVTYKIGLYSEDKPISDIQTVTFDSTSEEMADRKKEVILSLKNMVFSNAASYRLVFRDADNIDKHSIPVRIDRVFTNDF